MSILDHYEGDQLGSIKRIDAAYHTQFESFNPAVFLSGFSWQQIAFTEETGQLRLSVRDSEQGIIYKYLGSLSIPKLRSEAEDAILPLIGKLTVLKITDMNDRIYIIGGPNSPVNMELEGDTGSEFKSSSAYVVSFGVEQTWRAFTV